MMQILKWISLGTLMLPYMGLMGCKFYSDVPEYALVANPGDAPCDPLPGTSEPVYVCEEVTQGVLFVSETGQDDAPGTREEPVQTLQQALLLAREQTDKKAVLIAGAPVIAAPLDVTIPIDILGGFNEMFEPDTNARPSFESSQSPILNVKDVQESMRVSHVDLKLKDTEDAVFGVSVLNTTLLVLHDVNMTLPDGADGMDGVDGEVGADGSRGTASGAGTAVNPGQGGENTSCPEANGGTGGRGGDTGTMAEAGQASALGVAGGAPGQDGTDGMDGMNGGEGAHASTWMWRDGSFQIGDLALAGDDGAPGQGGSGGGGGLAQGSQGGGGGAGGAGGCGGTGGQPGTSGQPVIGLFVEDSTVIVEGNTTFMLGDGGDAGRGGAGQPGGMGAAGLPGAAGAGGQIGGRGGAGGSGGSGGMGGSGQAGESFGVFCVNGSIQVKDDSKISAGQGGVTHEGTQASQGETFGCDG